MILYDFCDISSVITVTFNSPHACPIRGVGSDSALPEDSSDVFSESSDESSSESIEGDSSSSSVEEQSEESSSTSRSYSFSDYDLSELKRATFVFC